MLSDAVLITLITTLGSVLSGAVSVIAVIWNRRKTDDKVTQVHEEVKQGNQRRSGPYPVLDLPPPDVDTTSAAHTEPEMRRTKRTE